MGSAPMKKPNFLVIVADDLGFSDTGPFGGEIKTPALDRIAKEGITLTNFHTASACSPTRSMLFSGTDNHIAGLGQMAEHMGKNRHLFDGKEGYEGYLNFKVAALSEILQDAGYLNMMSGKWHLGGTKEQAPCSRGFDKGFVYLPGSGNHYNYEPQFKEGEPRPSMAVLDPKTFWMRDGEYLDRRTELPEDFYSTKTFTDELLNYLGSRTAEEKEKPFFSYLAFTAPHWPLHAPREIIDKYKGMYDAGPEKLRLQRLERLTKMGLVPKDVEPAPMVGLLQDWEKMTDAEKADSARKMETFAAMVDLIDQNIQRILDYLTSTDELDNTFIVFMSDNGAEGLLLEAIPMLNGETSMGALIEKHYNNEIENIGNKDSFTWYGPGWACAAMAPSRGFKTWITEGGIRCPCLVRYPPLAGSKGTVTNTFTTVMDILPTILDLAGATHPHPSNFRGREVVPVRGKSWVPHLDAKDPQSGAAVHDETAAVTGWELFGARAIRQGKWKAIFMTAPRGRDDWELYDMDNDPGEIHDLAEKEPEVLKKLIQHWNVYYNEVGMFDPDITYHVVKDKLVE